MPIVVPYLQSQLSEIVIVTIDFKRSPLTIDNGRLVDMTQIEFLKLPRIPYKSLIDRTWSNVKHGTCCASLFNSSSLNTCGFSLANSFSSKMAFD